MINNINNKLNQNNVYSPNLNDKLNKPQTNIESNLLEQLKQMEKSQNEEIINFLKKINEQVAKAEIIAIKFIHREEITKDERQFISKNYPDIKKIVDETIKEEFELKKEIKLCETNILREKIIKDTITKIQSLSKGNIYSKTHVKIKMASVKNLQVFIEDLKKDNNHIEVIYKKIIKGKVLCLNEKLVLNTKYNKVKPFIKQCINEIDNFKESLKKIDNVENKKILLSEYIDKIENLDIKESIKIGRELKSEDVFDEIMDSKELIKVYENIKDLSIEELKNILKKDRDNIEKLYMSIYMNIQMLISKTNNIIIMILIVIIIIFIVF